MDKEQIYKSMKEKTDLVMEDIKNTLYKKASSNLWKMVKVLEALDVLQQIENENG